MASTDAETSSITKTEAHFTSNSDVDVAAQLAAGRDEPLDPQEAARLLRKIDWHLMPLMCILYLMTFADKISLGQSAVLGIRTDCHLSQNQFNWLGTVFYLSYLAFIYPQSLALQKFPVGKWMSANIFVWAVALCCHAACTSFGGLFVCRFILGVCEGAITPGFMIVTSMYYTRQEQTKRTGYWFLMNGFAIIFLGFVAFGTIHITTTKLHPWQWLMLITGILTFIVSVLFWFLFPDAPTNAWFLTQEERVNAVRRIASNQAGVENKHFKKDQMLEAFKDPKTWLFALFGASSNIFNSLNNQRQIFLSGFGFNLIQTTLLGCVDGVVEIVCIYIGVVAAAHWKNGRAYTAALLYIPSILGCILVTTLPSHLRVGLLFSYWLCIFAIAPFAIFLSWVAMSTSGHTKRVTVNAITLVAYAVGNAVSQFMWQPQYQPRNIVPFATVAACSVVSAIVLLATRHLLSAENKRRDQETPDRKYDEVVISVIDEEGKEVTRSVDKTFLDLTDIQNRDFRYSL